MVRPRAAAAAIPDAASRRHPRESLVNARRGPTRAPRSPDRDPNLTPLYAPTRNGVPRVVRANPNVDARVFFSKAIPSRESKRNRGPRFFSFSSPKKRSTIVRLRSARCQIPGNPKDANEFRPPPPPLVDRNLPHTEGDSAREIVKFEYSARDVIL